MFCRYIGQIKRVVRKQIYNSLLTPKQPRSFHAVLTRNKTNKQKTGMPGMVLLFVKCALRSRAVKDALILQEWGTQVTAYDITSHLLYQEKEGSSEGLVLLA